jgi:serine/threonine protein kinase
MISDASTSSQERHTRPAWSALAHSLRESRQWEDDSEDDYEITVELQIPPIEDIDSVAALSEYLAVLPDAFPVDFNKEDEALRMIIPGAVTTSRLIGAGMSFSVRGTKRPELSEAVLERFPTKRLGRYTQVAMKAARVDLGSNHERAKMKAIRAIAWEIHVLTHPPIQEAENIITLLGLTWQADEYNPGQGYLPVLALEMADQGSLDDLLNPREYCLHFDVKKKLCLDVAQGLRVLHESHIIHGDIKTHNILLVTNSEGTLTAKLSDFGSSVHTFGPDEKVRLPAHSPPWNAPEFFMDHIPIAGLIKTDIYCFGMLVWRVMLDGNTPLDFSIPDYYPWRRSFALLQHYNDDDDREMKIQNLKADASDTFLTMVLGTIKMQGLDEDLIQHILERTIRAVPDDRTHSMVPLISSLLGHFQIDPSLPL